MKTYSGIIADLPDNGIFVYGANTEGRHGLGAAKQAVKFGAVYGKVGLQGRTYGIITKDLRCKSHPSIPKSIIVSQIELLYLLADSVMYDKDFYVAYSVNKNLNGYSSKEMVEMFDPREAPRNIIFEQSFRRLAYE